MLTYGWNYAVHLCWYYCCQLNIWWHLFWTDFIRFTQVPHRQQMIPFNFEVTWSKVYSKITLDTKCCPFFLLKLFDRQKSNLGPKNSYETLVAFKIKISRGSNYSGQNLYLHLVPYNPIAKLWNILPIARGGGHWRTCFYDFLAVWQ